MNVAAVRGTETYRGIMYARGCDQTTLTISNTLFDVMLAAGVNYTDASEDRVEHLPTVGEDEAVEALRAGLESYLEDLHPDR